MNTAGFDERILLKSWLRTDSIWTSSWIYRSFLTRIPIILDLNALRKSQYWSRDRIRKLQAIRLKSLFRDAPRVPFWRDTFKRYGVSDDMDVWDTLTRLPVVPKKDFVNADQDYICDTSLRNLSSPDHTSGSTGQPFNFYFDRHAEVRSFAVTERMLRMAGGKRYPVVYLRARHRNGFTYVKHLWFFLQGYNAVKYRIDDLMAAIKQFPDGCILYGYTSAVIEVARCAQERGITLPLRAVMATGEGIRQSDREFIETALHTKFYHVYASRETGWLACECEYHNLHISEEWAYIEIVDDEGVALPAGREGRVIVTTFDNRVMPFIRYDIGDRGMIDDVLCPCGRTSRQIRFNGRSVEIITLDGGRTVSLLDLSAAIDSYAQAVRQFQIVQIQPLVFVFRIVAGYAFEKNKEKIEARLIRLLHPSASIQWENVEEIPAAKSGKAQYFIPLSRATTT